MTNVMDNQVIGSTEYECVSQFVEFESQFLGQNFQSFVSFNFGSDSGKSDFKTFLIDYS